MQAALAAIDAAPNDARHRVPTGSAKTVNPQD
jgi:hypothetical protein